MDMATHVATTTDRTVVRWLTPAVRKGIYGVVAAVLALLVAGNVITGEQSTQVQQIAEQLLSVAALVLAMTHTGGSYTGVVSLNGNDVGETPLR